MSYRPTVEFIRTPINPDRFEATQESAAWLRRLDFADTVALNQVEVATATLARHGIDADFLDFVGEGNFAAHLGKVAA